MGPQCVRNVLLPSRVAVRYLINNKIHNPGRVYCSQLFYLNI